MGYNFLPLDEETEKQYLWRLGNAKDCGEIDIDWEDIADYVNSYFRINCKFVNGANLLKRYQEGKIWYNEFAKVVEKEDDFSVSEITTEYRDESDFDELKTLRKEITKERQALHDERVALNREKREQNRTNSFAEQIIEALEERDFAERSYTPKVTHIEGETDIIIHLTDLHIGNSVDSAFNTYNDDIVDERLSKYLDNIYAIKNTHFVENAYVILGGDLIQGLIHVNSRIESKDDIVTQIEKASRYISDFIAVLSDWFENVKVFSVAGNHGRAVASKEESIRKENFDRLVTYICSRELKSFTNVKFERNIADVDIATFNVRGWNVWATHGDKDTPTNVVNHFNNFARHLGIAPPDICYLGHRHSNGLTTEAGVKVIESGSTVGMDGYCIGRRLCGNPEQTVTVVNESKPIVALYDITLN